MVASYKFISNRKPTRHKAGGAYSVSAAKKNAAPCARARLNPAGMPGFSDQPVLGRLLYIPIRQASI